MSRATSVVLGMVLGVASTLAMQWAWSWWSSPVVVVMPDETPSAALPVRDTPPYDAARAAEVMRDGPMLLEQALPGSKCLDVSVGYPSKRDVSYVHDALYDVDLTYQYRGSIKRVVLPFGFTGPVMVVPTTSEVVIADDTAEVVHKLQPKRSKQTR